MATSQEYKAKMLGQGMIRAGQSFNVTTSFD